MIQTIHEALSSMLFSGYFILFNRVLEYSITGYGALVVVSGIILYTLYIKRLLARDEPPPISTWCLWLLLDIAATWAEFARNVFNIQLVMYTLGTIAICAILFAQMIRGRFSKGEDKKWDTASAVAVFVAVATLSLTNNQLLGLCISLLGMTIASIPLFLAIARGADEPRDAWIVATVGSFISCFDDHLLSGIWLGILQLLVIVAIVYYSKRNASLSYASRPR